LHKVDGHYIGSDEANIFIATDDPERLCEEVKSLMSPAGFPGCRMAYRKMDGDKYTVLWPKGALEFEVH
jgi:hypothetical protein